MEIQNEIVVGGMVSRTVALALAVFTTAFICVSVAVVFTGSSYAAVTPIAKVAIASIATVAGV
ncbi:MAG: hypothetical protein ABI616_14845 [Pseudomonadota bacterium]